MAENTLETVSSYIAVLCLQHFSKRFSLYKLEDRLYRCIFIGAAKNDDGAASALPEVEVDADTGAEDTGEKSDDVIENKKNELRRLRDRLRRKRAAIAEDCMSSGGE